VGAPKGADSMAVSELSIRNTLIGSGWATAVILCTNGFREQSSYLERCLFLVGKLFSQPGQWLPAESHDYFKLINGWFES